MMSMGGMGFKAYGWRGINVWCIRTMDLRFLRMEGAWGNKRMGNDGDILVRIGVGQG